MSMLIIQDTTGITIKRTIQSGNHARIGIFETALWVDGVRRSVRRIRKPHVEFTLKDCSNLLDELEDLDRMI
jgi:hypothetical protein